MAPSQVLTLLKSKQVPLLFFYNKKLKAKLTLPVQIWLKVKCTGITLINVTTCVRAGVLIAYCFAADRYILPQ